MATSTDPFLWDVKTVVQALCTPSSPWTKDPASLAANIREEEIDGKTLLTFDEICTRQELMECLGIKRARHKASLAEELVTLRARSPQYRSWHVDFKKKQSLEVDEETEAPVVPNGDIGTPQKPPQRNGNVEVVAPSASNSDPDTEVSRTENNDHVHMATHSTQNGNSKKTSAQTIDDTNCGNSTSDVFNPPSTIAEGQPIEERPSKRKRLEPVNLSEKPLCNTQEHDPVPWENSHPWAYLGKGALPAFMIKSSSDQISTRLVRRSDDGFAVSLPNNIPPGRRLAVNHLMKHLLRKNGRIPGDGGDLTSSDQGDEVLDLEDLPDWDERTWREIKEEEEDNERDRNLVLYLSQERIHAIIAEVIELMKTNWQETKMKKYERKAHAIWTAARRHGTRTRQIIEARCRVMDFDERMQNISERILGERWQDEDEVRHQAQSLEQSLEDKCYELWLINTLDSRVEPPVPQHLSKPLLPRPRERPENPMDEILTSSDEEEEEEEEKGFIVQDEFIVPDDDFTAQDVDYTIQDNVSVDRDDNSLIQDDTAISNPGGGTIGVDPLPTTPTKSESLVVDLTQPLPHNGERMRTYIDLTVTPTKLGSVSHDPLPSQSSTSKIPKVPRPKIAELDVEGIAAQPRNHWGRLGDRWRLAIYMLRELSYDRRTAVLTTIAGTSNNTLWEEMVIAYSSRPLSNPEQLGSLQQDVCKFDLTRIFYTFVKSKYLKEARIAPLKPSDKKLIIASREKFEDFCKFIRNATSTFPKDSQIYKPDSLDQGISDDEMEAPQLQDTSYKSRKPAKEIVQDKGAVQLREDEKKRAEEQAARRLKLRKTLASGSMSRDKSRLIINEAKDEDQSLICVNEDIGKRIKDYQIDGVRFMWNQIIQPPETRQGCLLAHTMGLGKTMQVITFLVAIAEAASSPDLSTRSQIPPDLRKSQTLVLCPSGLVENWMDEILKWAPLNVLGRLSQLDSTCTELERLSRVRTWAQQGGVLIVGYNMFKEVLKTEEMETTLLEKPTLIIADEAHKIKNPETKLNQACTKFLASSRIALTGSPLANHVEEYYAIIDWVAPNFLGPLTEFRAIYVHDIDAGFYKDSEGWQKRRALKLLQVLKKTMAPKVDRKTIKSCLANDLPPKSEFVITVTPTRLQRILYESYINALNVINSQNFRQVQNFSVMNDLALICAHPRCFNEKVRKVKETPEKFIAFPKDLVSHALKETRGPHIEDPLLSYKTNFLTIILDEARRLGDKVLVFSQSIITLDYLENLCLRQKRRLFRLDGKTKIRDRQEITKEFNRKNFQVGLISTTAGGVGLNIQGANRVVIFDSQWNPVDDQQAVGRAYRIGQQKEVKVYHLMVAGTFEEDLHNRSVFKTQLAQRVVDKKNPISWSARQSKFVHHIKDHPKKDTSQFIGKDLILDKLIQYRVEGEEEGVIVSIVSTDTFEEEDMTATLTAQELREADDMVVMNRLRTTDPQEYERRLRRQVYQPGQHIPQPAPYIPQQAQHVPQPHLGASTPHQHSQVSHTMDGTSDVAVHPRGATFCPVQQNGRPMDGLVSFTQANPTQREWPQGPMARTSEVSSSWHAPKAAPTPLAGANTFFGQQHQQPKSQLPTSGPITTPLFSSAIHQRAKTEKPQSKGSSIFTQLVPSSEKLSFQEKIATAVPRLLVQWLDCPSLDQSPENLIKSLTDAVSKIRDEMKEGFLPDNQRWRCLKDLVEYDRFVLAAILGHLSPKWLAKANKNELERRIKILNSLSEDEFKAQLNRVARS